MSKKEKKAPKDQEPIQDQQVREASAQEAPPEMAASEETAPQEAAPETQGGETGQVSRADYEAALAQKEDQFLRLCAEYDNFRKRTQKEKEGIYADAKADAVKALLPVYDNLERALKQETADEAYKKGVEMTMTGLKKAFETLGVTEIPALGQSFDPNVHNAVMHVEDDSLGENTVAEVFQAGFMLGDKVIRFAMVKVAN